MKGYTVALISLLTVLLVSACASTQPITEPIAVIEAFHEALNDGDLDAAMSFVADDANFILFDAYVGKADIRDSFQEFLDEGYLVELSDLRADSDKVFWMQNLTVGGGRFFESPYEAVVQEGMIVSLTYR